MPSRDRPNILVIMSDQHSKHMLGCYGDRLVRTPNLDRLAAEGMRFDNAYCPSPLCVPSRMSFMTCRTPSRNRAWHNGHVLSSGIPTWAHVLGAAGYETSLIGRMHFVGPDQRHGFENRPIGEFLARHPGAAVPGGPMFTRYSAHTTGQARVAVEIAGHGHTHYQWSDEQVTQSALGYLREHAAGGIGRPFAAVVGYMLPHCPYIAPKELFDYYYPLVDIPPVEEHQPATIARFRRDRGILDPPLSEEQIRVARAAYFGLCEQTDRMAGRILDCLDQTGLAENTLMIYTSDHGDMAGEHDCWWKSNYYEGSVGVPLIARLPGAVSGASACDAACNLMDLGVTFAELAGAEFRPTHDGRSLWPLLSDRAADAVRRRDEWADETFSELDDVIGSVGPSRMVRSGPWKLWVFGNGAEMPPALFNMADDPGELRDLAEDPRYSDVRESLLLKVRDRWDPDAVHRESEDAYRSLETLRAWGDAVQPRHPDTLVMAPAEYEDDVEFL